MTPIIERANLNPAGDRGVPTRHEDGLGRGRSMSGIDRLKRKIYLAILPLGILALALGWLIKELEQRTTIQDRILFPIGIVIVLILLLAIWRVPSALHVVELLLYVGIAASLLLKLYEILYQRGSLDFENFATLADLLYWFPMVYIFAFINFRAHRSLVAASVFCLATFAVSIPHLLTHVATGDQTVELSLILRFLVANVAYIVLTFVVTRMNAEYVRARTTEDLMRHTANTDALTNIFNRRRLDILLLEQFSTSIAENAPLSTVMFDIDHFKNVNDTFGHEAGDLVLQEVARRVQVELGPTGYFGRWGGEEFLVILPGLDAPAARVLAERLRRAITHEPMGRFGSISASFGVATPHASDKPASLIHETDLALYRAKANGRNRVEIFTRETESAKPTPIAG